MGRDVHAGCSLLLAVFGGIEFFGDGYAADAGHGLIHPGFALFVDVGGAKACGLHRFADDDADGARAFDERAAAPEFTGVVGDQYHRRFAFGGQQGATNAPAFAHARRDAGAFGEDDDPDAIFEALDAFVGDLFDGLATG